jgi:mRNA-degrading endonuclease YafQ of YafQ-DinJ toxin-antitoxin module
MEIIYAPKFLREYKKLPPKAQREAEKKEALFRTNPFDTRLVTHKLHGRLRDFWSFSIGFRYWAVFQFGEGDIVYFYSVGNHNVYQ